MSKKYNQLSPKFMCTSVRMPISTRENMKTIPSIFGILWTLSVSLFIEKAECP